MCHKCGSYINCSEKSSSNMLPIGFPKVEPVQPFKPDYFRLYDPPKPDPIMQSRFRDNWSAVNPNVGIGRGPFDQPRFGSLNGPGGLLGPKGPIR